MPCRQLEQAWSPVCQATHKYRQVERMFQCSLGICVAVIPKNLGILKASQRHYAEADLLLNQSFLWTNQNLGHEHPEVLSSRKVFAQVLSTGHRDTEGPWAGLRM